MNTADTSVFQDEIAFSAHGEKWRGINLGASNAGLYRCSDGQFVFIRNIRLSSEFSVGAVRSAITDSSGDLIVGLR